MSHFVMVNLTFHVRRDADLDYLKVVNFEDLSMQTQVFELLHELSPLLDLDSFTWFSWK